MSSRAVQYKSNSNHTSESIQIVLTTLVDDERAVYITGNFNNWQVGQEKYQLKKDDLGRYIFHLDKTEDLPETLEYKYTKGKWSDVELNQYGNPIENRQIVVAEAAKVIDIVHRWKKAGLVYNEAYYPKVELISDEFHIPQLDKNRRVRVVLPHDYYESEKQYPVIYMQDGQNLFDQAAPFGNWGMDKKMAVLAEHGMGDFIIVPIDHAEGGRINEYTPFRDTRLGIGDGKKYARFMADTLKPYIDKNYRTKSEREYTGIGGSSMGGLISIYIGLMYPEVFGRLMIFSPSLWVTPNIHFNAINFFNPYFTKIYLYAGGKESVNMVPNIHRLKTAFENGSSGAKLDFNLNISPKGEHTEKQWGVEFPKAIEWLFFGKENEEEE